MNLISRIEITRDGNRNWAVWLDRELLAVTVYKKGAQAVAHALMRISTSAGKEVHHVILAA
jgi:hypothetical protein